jgi:hypothetical protein
VTRLLFALAVRRYSEVPPPASLVLAALDALSPVPSVLLNPARSTS